MSKIPTGDQYIGEWILINRYGHAVGTPIHIVGSRRFGGNGAIGTSHLILKDRSLLRFSTFLEMLHGREIIQLS